MKNLFYSGLLTFTLICGFAFSGCQTTPVQVKAGADPIVVNAEWLAENAAASLGQFIAFERANESALKAKFPDAHGFADLIRDDVVENENGQLVPASVYQLRKMTKQYQVNKAGGDEVSAASTALLSLINEVRGYMGLPPLTFPVAKTQSVREQMLNAPTNGPPAK